MDTIYGVMETPRHEQTNMIQAGIIISVAVLLPLLLNSAQFAFADGRVFTRMVNGSGTHDTIYYYDSSDLIARRDVWDNNKTYYYHPDHLGSTTLITDQGGNTVEQLTYEPYGLVFSGDPNASRFLYTGKELDGSTGLYYYGARYYDPELGQFVEPDPGIPDPYDPQMLNRFSYARGNPYKYTDPSGNLPTKATYGNLWSYKNFVESLEKSGISDPRTVSIIVANKYSNLENAGSGPEKAPEYIYTEMGRHIDMKHFTGTVAISMNVANDPISKISPARPAVKYLAAMIFAYGSELFQTATRSNSGFSPEDIPSYSFGGLYGAIESSRPFSLTPGSLSESSTQFLNSLGATDKENAPDYNNLPERSGNIPSSSLPIGLMNFFPYPVKIDWSLYNKWAGGENVKKS